MDSNIGSSPVYYTPLYNSNFPKHNKPPEHEKIDIETTAQKETETKKDVFSQINLLPQTNQETIPKTGDSTRNYNETSPLFPAGTSAIKGEFKNIPLKTSNALSAYSNMKANDFSGPGDIRLDQIYKAAKTENIELRRNLEQMLKEKGIEGAEVASRTKSQGSIYGKLVKDGSSVGDLKDLSAARINLDISKPNFEQHYQVTEAINNQFGENITRSKDYIKNPSEGGYTGRVHSNLNGNQGIIHETQIGSKDLSDFIDRKIKGTNLHDAVYKGEQYGIKTPKELGDQYQDLMKRITETNKNGGNVSNNPALKADIDEFAEKVSAHVPDKLPKTKPEGTVSQATKLKKAAGKSLGVAGLAAGTLQAYEGLNEIKAGKTIEGSADIAGGSLATVSGAAILKGATKVAGVTGGVAAVIDGTKDMYVGIKSGDNEKTVVGGFKTAGGGMMIAGAATANPALLAAGVITYGGAVIYENREAIKNAAVEAADTIAEGAAWTYNKASGIGASISDSISDRATQAKEFARNSGRKLASFFSY